MSENERSDGLFAMAPRQLRLGDQVVASTLLGDFHGRVVKIEVDEDGSTSYDVHTTTDGGTIRLAANRVRPCG